ncbi:MAG: hypothetical protein WDM77_15000 [Steroidobacteraceae bacterium]
MPYLIPLFQQVGLGFEPFHAGLMLLPTSLAAMLTKRSVTNLIRRFGYRSVLVANTCWSVWPWAVLRCWAAPFRSG